MALTFKALLSPKATVVVMHWNKKAAESLVRNYKTLMFGSGLCIWSPFLAGFSAEDPAGTQLFTEYVPVPLLFGGAVAQYPEKLRNTRSISR